MKPKRKSKKAALIIGIALALLLLLFISIPYLLSTHLGKEGVVYVLSKSGRTQYAVGPLHLKWFGPQNIEALEVKHDNIHFTCQKLSTDASLFELIWGSKRFTKCLDSTENLPPGMHLEQGVLEIAQGNSLPLKLQNIDMHLSNSKDSPLVSLKLTGQVEQDKTLGHFDITAQFERTANPTIELAFHANSNLIDAQFETVCKEGHIALKKQAMLSFSCSPELLSSLSSFFPILQEVQLTRTARIDVTIDELAFAIPKTSCAPCLENLGFEGSFQVTPIELILPSLKNPVTVDALKGTLSTNNLAKSLQMQMSTEVHSPDITALVTINAELTDIMQDKPQGLFSVQIASDQLKLPEAKFIWNKELWAEEPFEFTLLPSAQEIGALKLIGVKPIGGRITKFVLPENFSLKEIKCEAEISAPFLEFQLPAYTNPWRVNDLFFTLKCDTWDNISITTQRDLFKTVIKAALKHPTADLFELSLSAHAYHHDKAQGALEASVILDAGVITEAKINIHDVATSFLEHTQELSTLLGSSFSAQGHYIQSNLERSFALKTKSPLLNMQAAFALKENAFELKTQGVPAFITLQLTADSYALIDNFLTKDQDYPFVLSHPSVFKLNLSALKIPFLGSGIDSGIDFAQAQFQGKVEVDNFSLVEEQSKQEITLKDLTLSLNKADAKSPILFDLTSRAKAKSTDGKAHAKGTIDLTDRAAEIDLSIQHFPVLFFDIILRAFQNTDPIFTSLFGETLNATLTTNIQNSSGPFNLNINSPSTKASVVGRLDEGTLTLSERVYAQLMMSEKLSALILDKVNPLSISSFHSNHPMTLEIDPEGFSLPLLSMDTAQVKVPHARIELGKIYCKNEGNLNIALLLFRSRALSSEKEVQVWFAPIDMTIDQGMMNMERTEILIGNTFDVALWGTVDLIEQYINMTLGLTAESLNQAFGIKDLPKDYLLHIPIKGKKDHVKINTVKTTAKIATLLAWQQKAIAGALGGGAPGLLFGELVNKFGPLPDKGKYAPAAKHPFPWESEKKNDKETSDNSGHKDHPIKKTDKPIKQLMKLIL